MTAPQNPHTDGEGQTQPVPAEALHAANPGLRTVAEVKAAALRDAEAGAAAIEATLEQRVTELESAFHASMTHMGQSHPTVVAWVEKMKARIAALLHGTPAAG